MESPRLRPLAQSARGFTLVEMLVALSILTVITAIALTSQSTFNQSLLLNDTSYTIALSAREAQSLGLSSRKFQGVQNGGYGVHFAYPYPITTYTVFADISSIAPEPAWCPITATTTPEAKAGNCLYDGAGETFQTYDLTRGFKISDICGKNQGLARKCASTGDIDSLDVLYLRPNTQAIITGLKAGIPTQFTCAEVWVMPPTGTGVTETIRMSQLGEISVGQTCP